VLTPLVVALLCGFGMMACYRIMIDEVQVRLPENARIRMPAASWNTLKITRLHRDFYPGSRISAVFRLLARVALACFATVAIVMIYAVFSKPPR